MLTNNVILMPQILMNTLQNVQTIIAISDILCNITHDATVEEGKGPRVSDAVWKKVASRRRRRANSANPTHSHIFVHTANSKTLHLEPLSTPLSYSLTPAH